MGHANINNMSETLQKSHWVTDKTRVSLSVPFAKVDRENRLVSGFATIDNIDQGQDVVTAEASASAFSRFRGNIREMHQPIAAGKLVDFSSEPVIYEGKVYTGIYVTVYISRGAQSTWEKVLDGTLTGFSIGGEILDEVTEYVADADALVRFIKDYSLLELSIVDSPMNQLCNVLSVVKVDGVDTLTGIVADTRISNVFWCETDSVSKFSVEPSSDCLACGGTMEQIGWFELSSAEDNVNKAMQVTARFLQKGEGGGNMNKDTETTEVVEKSETPAPEAQVESPAEEVAPETVVEQTAEEEAPAVVEEVSAETDIEKLLDEVRSGLAASIETTVTAVEKRVSEATASFAARADELEKGLAELNKSLEEIRTWKVSAEKSLDALDKASAMRKSREGSTEPALPKAKGLWGGAFFDA